MRRPTVFLLVFALVALGLVGLRPSVTASGSPNDTPTGGASAASAIIDNGTIQMGINDEGHLNIAGGTRSWGTSSTTNVGLRFIANNSESTAPGCLCEGWGIADAITGEFAWANVAQGGTSGIVLNSFTTTGTGTLAESAATTATSVVTTFGRLRVTHDYHPSAATPNLYEVDVTIENISSVDVDDLRYTRVMDWDTPYLTFSEYVTIQGLGSATNLLYVDDNGFQNPNPLLSRYSPYPGGPGNQIDSGPADHGALFDFGFGALAAGDSRAFKTFYGAAANETGAIAALTAVGAEAYSFGQPNYAARGVLSDPTVGNPNTFIFAFSGVGGDPLFASITLDPDEAENPAGTDHTVTATVTEGDEPLEGVEVTFEVISGPNTGATGTAVTGPDGTASWTYSSNGILGTDEIIASFVDSDGETKTSIAVTKTWIDGTPPVVGCDETVNPHGKNVPRAGQKSKGQNEDGFYVLTAEDAIDPHPQIFVNGFGPFMSGNNVKITESDDEPPQMKKMGSTNGSAGAIAAHLILNSDAMVTAVDASGNAATVACLVPPPPK